MTAEQKPGLAQLLIATIEDAVPILRNHRRDVEQASRSLDFAWSELGGESGRDVQEEQISAVLKAELRVLQAPWIRFTRPSPIYMSEDYLLEALKFHTYRGLDKASIFMFVRRDHWRQVAHQEQEINPDSQSYHEARRRLLACSNAQKLLNQKSLKI